MFYDRITRIVSALSQLANVVILDGDPNESISGRAHRQGWRRTERVINCIFFWQLYHCRSAYLRDMDWAILYQHQTKTP